MTHFFLKYSTPAANERMVRDIAVCLLNFYLKEQPGMSRSKLLKDSPRIYSWWSESGGKRTDHKSKQVHLREVEGMLTQERTFDYKRLGLYDPQSDWLDGSIAVSSDFHSSDETGQALTFKIPLNLGTESVSVKVVVA